MVKLKQIWEDKDKRRAGRTFKIQNIDLEENKATVEILTGPGGKRPDKNNEISFIRLDRFNVSKYYRLVQDVVSVFASEPDPPKSKFEEKITVFQDTDRGVKEMETIIVRKPTNNKSLMEQCQEHWPGSWQNSGPFSSLTSDRFEVMVRQSQNFSKMLDVKVKLDKFCIYNIVSDKPLSDVLMTTRTALAKIAEDLIDMVVPDESEQIS